MSGRNPWSYMGHSVQVKRGLCIFRWCNAMWVVILHRFYCKDGRSEKCFLRNFVAISTPRMHSEVMNTSSPGGSATKKIRRETGFLIYDGAGQHCTGLTISCWLSETASCKPLYCINSPSIWSGRVEIGESMNQKNLKVHMMLPMVM
jgi:hypothetical protein